MLSKLGWIFLVFLLEVGFAKLLFAQEPFYKGKTVRLIVGFSAGGGFDTYARVIARHMTKYIVGEPTIIVENMPGAGSLIAANHGYNTSKPDGLTINNWIGGLVLQAVLGSKGIQFQAPKFEWIGALQDSQSCGLTKASGVANVQEWFATKKLIKLGGTASGSTDVDIPRILKATLGLPIQLVEGYKGTADIRIAADSGEVSGYCGTWAGMKSTWSQALESGNANVVIQINSGKHPDLTNVPNAIDLATTDEARDLIRLLRYETGASKKIERNHAATVGQRQTECRNRGEQNGFFGRSKNNAHRNSGQIRRGQCRGRANLFQPPTIQRARHCLVEVPGGAGAHDGLEVFG